MSQIGLLIMVIHSEYTGLILTLVVFLKWFLKLITFTISIKPGEKNLYLIIHKVTRRQIKSLCPSRMKKNKAPRLCLG